MKLNVKNFKKISSNDTHTTMRNDAGHEIKIAHKGLHPATRGQLAALPMADGGQVAPQPTPGAPNLDPDKVKKFKFGMAEGGAVSERQKKQDLVDSTGSSELGNTLMQEPPRKEMPKMASGGKVQHPDDAIFADMSRQIAARREEGRTTSEGDPEPQAAPASEPSAPMQPVGSTPGYQENAERFVKGFNSRGYADGGEVAPDSVSINTQNPTLPDSLINPNPGSQAMPSLPPGVNEMTPQQQVAANPGALPFGVTPDAMAPAPQAAPEAAAPMAPQGAAAAPAPSTAGTPSDPYGNNAYQDSYMKGLNSEMAGLHQEAKAAETQGNAQAELLGKQAGIQAQQQTDYQNHFQALDTERKALQQDIQNNHIDPNHFINSMDTGSRISTAIGLIASGMGSGMGGGPNLAAHFLDKQIDNDIMAQKANLGKKENLLSANMKQFGNLRDATDMTRVMQSDILANQMRTEAAKQMGPMAKANLLKAAGDLEMKSAPILSQIAMRKSLMSGMANGRVAPEAVIRMIVPEHEQAGATKQLKEAQDAVSLRDNTLSDFDKLTKINTMGNRALNPLQSKRQVDAIKGAALDKLTKDISGRVTPETVHLIGGMFDTLGTNPETAAVLRRKLNETLSNSMHYPELKKWGIDVTDMGRYDKMGNSRIPEGKPKR